MYETTKVRNNETAKQRRDEIGNNERAMRNCESARLQNTGRVLRNNERAMQNYETAKHQDIGTAKQRKSDGKQQKGDAKERDFKQRKYEVTLYPDAITSSL